MRDTVDPIVDTERAPDIGFLIPEIKSKLGLFGTNLWNALNKLRRPSPDQDFDKTFYYLGVIPTDGTTDILTHRFVLDIPIDRYWELTSFTLTLTTAPTSKCELVVKRMPKDETAYESILDDKNIFIVEGYLVGSRFDFLVSKLYCGDEINIDVVTNGGASNPEMFMRGKLRKIV